MSKFKLKEMEVGATRYFDADPMGYRDIAHTRRNLSVTIHAFRKRNPGTEISAMTVGERLMVRRWK